MREIALALFVGEFLGCLLFCILFGLRSRWWTSGMGQNMLAMMFVLTVLQGLGVMRLVLDPTFLDVHAEGIRVWSFGALFVVVWWRVIILMRVQHDDAVVAKEARRNDAKRARDDAQGAHEDAVEAREDAQGAHEDAQRARQVRDDIDDTDPNWDKANR